MTIVNLVGMNIVLSKYMLNKINLTNCFWFTVTKRTKKEQRESQTNESTQKWFHEYRFKTTHICQVKMVNQL